MVQRARASYFLFIALAGALPSLIACGIPAAPQAPTLYLPQPPTDLTASRSGNDVHLHWTMPKRSTDKVLLRGDQDAHICRHVENGPCEAAGDARFAPEASAEFVDHLPSALTAGQPKLIGYTVELRNHRGRTAGPSNQAFSAAGEAPASAAGFAAQARAEGVVLHWQATQDASTLLRLDRVLILKAGESTKPNSASMRKGAEAPPQQRLEVPFENHHDPANAFDNDAALDHTYRYTAVRIAKVTLAGHEIEISSAPAETTINARDVFPPAVPSGLITVSSPDEHAIDLSWTPNTENDLAGYIVYRRETGSSAAPVRLSPAKPVTGPAFHDDTARPGARYAYSVSSIDLDGNESAHSQEVEESLPSTQSQ
jgi:hypothetical protein